MSEFGFQPARLSTKEISRMRIAMRLSLSIGVMMLVLKISAYLLTNSAAILSDAAESIVHVLAVGFAAYSFSLSIKPPDKEHPYGHDRVSFFSAGFEGAMILLASLFIIYEAIMKWISGLYLERLDEGIALVAAATLVNAWLGWHLVKLGKKYRSLVLEANGKHVLTDSWTSLGVIVALLLTQFTGWLPFDPLLAIVVALNILIMGIRLMHRSVRGLMDESDPEMSSKIQSIFEAAMAEYKVKIHAVRHRNSGNRVWVEFHMMCPEQLTLARSHEIATIIERDIKLLLPIETEVLSHIEPLEGHDEIHDRLLKK